MTRYKLKDTCTDCMMKDGCRHAHSVPALGPCSLKLQDNRIDILKRIHNALETKGECRLPVPMTVMRDDVCGPLPFIIIRVRSLRHSAEGCLAFDMGTDADGTTVTSDEIATRDLYRISQTINPAIR